MSEKPVVSYKTDLEFIQSLDERELSELVLMPLFERLGYHDIRYVHGVLEDGKDIVFSRHDPLDHDVRCCATVKRRKLSGSVSSSRSIRELYFQIEQALKEPYLDPFTGREVILAKIYVVTPFPASNSCIRGIRSKLNSPDNRLAFIDGPKLYSLIRKHLPDLLSTLPDPELRYMDGLIRRLTETGSQLAYANRRSLLDICIAGRVSRTTAEDARLISFAGPFMNVERRTAVADTLPNLTDPFVVLLADVGAGKTTFLQKIAIDLVAKNTHGSPNEERVLPLLVPLHLIPAPTYLDENKFIEAIAEYFRERHSYQLAENFDEHEYLLLLDGFDEIPSAHREASALIQRLALRPFKGLVVTSRPSRIPLLSSPFSYFRLEPFSDGDIAEFLDRWFKDDSELYYAVLDKIRGDSSLSVFCRSPLLLTLYAVLAQRRPVARLPVRRTDIYDLVADFLLARWDDSRGIKNNLEKASKEFVLEKVALDTQRVGKRTFSWDLLRGVTDELFQAGRLEGDSEDLIGEIIYRSSLIRPIVTRNASRSLEFTHLSFQEYFAAKRLIRIPDTRLIERCLLDEWWRGTFIFYFGLKRSMDEIALASRKKMQGHGLALMELLSEADYTSEKLRDSILKVVGTDLMFKKNLSDAELEICSRIGPRILDTLRDAIKRSGPSVDAGNFFRIAFNMKTSFSLQMARDNPAFLPQLSLGDLLFTLERTAPLISGMRWLNFLDRALSQLEFTLTSMGAPPWGVARELEAVLGLTLREIRMAAEGRRIKERDAEYFEGKVLFIWGEFGRILPVRHSEPEIPGDEKPPPGL